MPAKMGFKTFRSKSCVHSVQTSRPNHMVNAFIRSVSTIGVCNIIAVYNDKRLEIKYLRR